MARRVYVGGGKYVYIPEGASYEQKKRIKKEAKKKYYGGVGAGQPSGRVSTGSAGAATSQPRSGASEAAQAQYAKQVQEREAQVQAATQAEINRLQTKYGSDAPINQKNIEQKVRQEYATTGKITPKTSTPGGSYGSQATREQQRIFSTQARESLTKPRIQDPVTGTYMLPGEYQKTQIARGKIKREQQARSWEFTAQQKQTQKQNNYLFDTWGVKKTTPQPQTNQFSWPATIKEAGFEQGVMQYIPGLSLVSQTIYGLAATRYSEIRGIEKKAYEMRQKAIETGSPVAGIEKWRKREIAKTERKWFDISEEGKNKYQGNLLERIIGRISNQDIPYINIELGHKGRVFLGGVGLSAVGIVPAAGATTVKGAAWAAGAYQTSYGYGSMAGNWVTAQTNSPFLGTGTSLVLGYGGGKLATGYTPPIEVTKVDLPGQKWVGIAAKGKPIAGYNTLTGQGYLRGLRYLKNVKTGTKAVAPITLPEGGAFIPQASTASSGLLKTSLTLAAIEKQTGFIPTEVTRVNTGLDIMRTMYKQPSAYQRDLILTNIKGIPEKAMPSIEKIWKKYNDDIIVKGSFAATSQYSPKALEVARPIGDIDWATIGKTDPAIIRKDLLYELRKNKIPAKEEGITVVFEETGKGLDIMRRDQMALEGLGKEGETEGEFMWGLPIKQKPVKVGGKLVQPLNEQLVRKGATTLTIQRRGNNYFVNPEKMGRVYKDIYDFEKTITPTLIDSAKLSPKTMLKGLKTEQKLKDFTATRGEDFTAPIGLEEVSFFKAQGRLPVKAFKPAKVVGDKVGGKVRVKSKVNQTSVMEVGKEATDFYYASEKAYYKLYPKKPKKGYSIPTYYPSGGLPKSYPYGIPYKVPKPTYTGYTPQKYTPQLDYPYTSYPPTTTNPPYTPPTYKPPTYNPPYTPPTYKPPTYNPPYYPPTTTNPPYTPPYPPMIPPLTNIPKKGGIIPVPPLPKIKSNKEVQGYDVLVKRKQNKKGKGNYISRGYAKVNKKPLTQEAAYVLGASTVDKYSNRSFYLKKSKKQTKPAIQKTPLFTEILKQKFRKKKGNKLIYTEKTRYAIDSLQEKQQIPYESIKQRKLGLFQQKRKTRKRKK